MIMPSHYALLTEAADALVVNGVIGEPTKERKSRGKARARDERGRFIRQQETAQADRRESPSIQRAAHEELDAAYQETFSSLSTTKMEDLLLGGNERLDQLLELIGSWWKWEKRQMQTMRAETRKRNRLAEMEELHNQNRDQVANQRAAGSGHPLDSLFDAAFGGEGPDVGGRKKGTRTRRTPRVKKAGFFSRAGAKVMSGLGTVGKAGALAATGALGLFGASKVLADTPEPDADLNNRKVETKTADVKRTAAAAVDDAPDLNRATKNAAQAEKGMFGKLGGLGKVAGVAGSLLTVGLVANEAMSVHDNNTLTDKEKNKEYSKLGGTTAGSVLGGAGGAWLGAQGGAAAGALVGSVVPIVGTAVGAAVGTAVGAVLGGGLGSFFGGDVGEKAGSMVYDVVVRDDQIKEDDTHKVEAELKSPELEKLAKANEAQGGQQSWWSRLFGGAQATAGSYARGVSGYTPGTGYGANRDNVVPRAGGPAQRIDYRADPNYVAGQGVLKNLPMNNKQEQRLSQWSSLIEDKASKHGVDPMLVRSVIKQESGGRADAQSGVGATGLMQLMPGTASDVGVRNSWDPDQNVEGGTKYLSQMIKQFDGNVPVALAAYNWGPGNMRKLIRKTGSTDINELMQYMPKETQGYVQNITRSHAAYQEQAAATAPKADAATVEVDRTAQSSEIAVQRTDTSDNIVTQTTPPPAIAQTQPAKEVKPKRDRQSPQLANARQAPPRAISAVGGQDPTSLDDMPLLLTDHGLGSLLTGHI